jgi:hypothetical protein
MHRWVIVLALCVLALVVWAAEAPEPTVAPSAEDKALATHALALATADLNNMGRETANFLLYDWPNGLAKQLLGETPATAKSLDFARSVVKGMLTPLERAQSWPAPPTLKVPYARKAPKMDGKLDGPEWKHALVLHGAYAFNETTRTDNTTWKLLWDQHYLYVGVYCQAEDIVAPIVKRNGPVYDNDCVEAFILPEMKTLQYWELEANPTGGLFESRCTKKPDHWGGVNDTTVDMKGLQIATAINGTPTVYGTPNKSDGKDKGYTIEMAIPVAELPGMTPASLFTRGQSFHLLLARMDRSKGTFTAYAFLPLLSWTHNVWNYAPVVLSK